MKVIYKISIVIAVVSIGIISAMALSNPALKQHFFTANTLSKDKAPTNSLYKASNSSNQDSSFVDAELVNYATINPNDSVDIKQKKQKYNDLINQIKKQTNEFQMKQKNGTATSKDYEENSQKAYDLYNQLHALGIDPSKDETPDQKYEKNVRGYISDKEMLLSEYTDKNGNVIPQYAKDYEVALKRKNYLEQIERDYNAGKISADDALKSFTDQYTVIQ